MNFTNEAIFIHVHKTDRDHVRLFLVDLDLEREGRVTATMGSFGWNAEPRQTIS